MFDLGLANTFLDTHFSNLLFFTWVFINTKFITILLKIGNYNPYLDSCIISNGKLQQ